MDRTRQQSLEDSLASRILVLDGAMGTMIQQRNLTVADFGGPALEDCNENLVLTRPDVILDIHRAYLRSRRRHRRNQFLRRQRRSSLGRVRTRRARPTKSTCHAARLARQAADEFSTPAKPRFVAGSMGPTTKAITVTGDVTFAATARRLLRHRPSGLLEGGADSSSSKPAQDTRNVKAALARPRPPRKSSAASASPSWSPAPSNPWAPCSPARPPTPSRPPSPTSTCSPSA